MVFQQPNILYGLFLLAIPVLIHFLNFRKTKTIYFSSLRFLDEVESTFRKRNRLTDLLLLLIRMVLIASLVVAFAQPVIPYGKADSASSGTHIAVFIDNSPSMSVIQDGESLLLKARRTASELVSGFSRESRFKLIYASQNDLPGITDKETTLKLIDTIQQSDIQLSFEEILSSATEEIDQIEAESLILISDFQHSLRADINPDTVKSTRIYLIPVTPSTSANISIDSCWLENPMIVYGQNNSLTAIINNRSNQDYVDFPVRLIVNDTLRNEMSIALPAHSVKEVSLSFHPNFRGRQTGSVEISDFPVIFDNKIFFSFNIESDIPVLLLHGGKSNVFIERVYSEDTYFRFEAFSQEGFPRSDFNDYSLVIVASIKELNSSTINKLTSYINQGGTVWFLPEFSGNLNSYNTFLRTTGIPDLTGQLNYRAESRIPAEQNGWLQQVVVNVDKRLRLPIFNRSFRIPVSRPDRIDLLNSASGDLLLTVFPHGNGSVILSGFSLEESETDLMFHPLFIPLCYRFATLSNKRIPLYHINGSVSPLPVIPSDHSNNKLVALLNPLNQFRIIPPQRPGRGNETILYPDRLPEQGLYFAVTDQDTLAKFAFNIGREESRLEYYNDSVLSSRLKNAGWNIITHNYTFSNKESRWISEEISVKKIWYLFLIMALGALIAESIVMLTKK